MMSIRWIILWSFVAVCTSFDIRCPTEQACNCQYSHDGDTEIHCLTENDATFVVNALPVKYIQIKCTNTSRWTDFHLRQLFSMDVESMYFRMCNLPTNSSLGEIAHQLGIGNVEKLVFQSFYDLNTRFTRKHLSGFPKLQKLVLSSNGFTNLSGDIFADVPDLIWLDLRENNVRLFPGIFESTPNLEVLELGNNMMERIEPGIFDTLSKLRLLNLWNNRFTELKSGTFDKLVSLRSLDINTNDLTTLPEDIFAKLENLEVLNLFWNNFTTLPENLLQHNVKLKTVNLYSNKKNMTTFPNGLFANLRELKVVQLKRNGLIYLPEDLFRESTSLKNISLERNYLTTLPAGIFKGLTNLLEVELGFNEITSLPDDLFMSTVKLIRLDLSKNHITSISRYLFRNLKSLVELNMSENQLQIIEDSSFNSLQALRIAKFSNNQLTLNTSLAVYHDEYGAKSPFLACKFLEELYLARNNITELFSDWIISSLHLRILDLTYNAIPYISAEDLQFVSNNIKVDLRHNNISGIYLRSAETIAMLQNTSRDVIILVDDNPLECNCGLYDFLRYLEGRMHPYVQNYFHIEPASLSCKSPTWLMDIPIEKLNSQSLKCQITEECPQECTCWLRPSDKSVVIDCSYRNLTRVPHGIKFLGDTKLELNFTGNALTQMLPLAEHGLEGGPISKLLMSNNDISDIHLNTLPDSIEVLELHNNNISKISTEVLQFMNNSTTLAQLTLHGNPWMCDCNARDFLNFIQTKVEEIPNSLLITCAGMEEPMLKMTATDFCPVDTMLIVGISMAIAVTGLIIGMLAALYYRYQREIKVWLYAHQLCLWLVTEDELDKDKIYDAFISYSHKDEEFVVNELVSKLENGPRPFKLCLHYRDWLAGEWIPTQIARSVEDSRRTIVILSPNFLESVWGRMEFRAAHSQALSEGRARVILILYGEIGPTENLDPELKAYLSMNTYVKWGDPWFWDKLRYALPHPPEFRKNTIRKKIFEKHQPCIQINGEKKELIYPADVPETPPAASTPPADTLKVFICDENNENKKMFEDIPKKDSGSKLILSPEEILKKKLTIKDNIIMSKIQCTTV